MRLKFPAYAILLLAISGCGADIGTEPSPTASPAPATTTAPPAVTTPPPATEPSDPPPPTTIRGDGIFPVPEEVRPGRYKTAGPKDSIVPLCYYAMLSNLTGDLDSIISNENIQGPATVVIPSTVKGFKTQGCKDWIKVG